MAELRRVTLKDHLCQPYLILTAVLFATTLVMALTSFLFNEWAISGNTHLGLLESCTEQNCTSIHTFNCSSIVALDSCRQARLHLQGCSILMITALVISLFGLVVSTPGLLGRYIFVFGCLSALFSAFLYLGAFVLFLVIERSFLSFANGAKFGSGFVLCVACSGTSLLSAGVALLAWRYQAIKFHGRRYSVLRYRRPAVELEESHYDTESDNDTETN